MYGFMIPFTNYATTPTLSKLDLCVPGVKIEVSNPGVKIELVKGLGIKDPGLWKICPKEYRHLLRDERRPELKNRKVELW